jgi:hypothetical protein
MTCSLNIVTKQSRSLASDNPPWISLNRRGLFLIFTPMALQVVQVSLLCKLLDRVDTYKMLAHAKSVSEMKTCLAVGLILTGLFFLAATLIFSRAVIRRARRIQENIRRFNAALPLLPPPPVLDELSDLDADVRRLIQMSAENGQGATLSGLRNST